METLEGFLLGSAEQKEAERLRERNRVAKRASRARQKHQRTTEPTSPQGPISNGRQPSEDWIPQPTTADEQTPQPFPAPRAVAVPSHSEPILDTLVDNDESWVSFDTAVLSDPSTAQWNESLGSAAGFSDGIQQAIISSSLPGHTSPTLSPHSGQKLSFYKLGANSILTSHRTSGDLLSRNSDLASSSSRLLHIAIRNGTKGIAASLIKAGADVNSIDASGSTPLHVAVELQHLGILELLVNSGANINASNSASMTPLELAVRAQNEEAVDVLLSRGATIY